MLRPAQKSIKFDKIKQGKLPQLNAAFRSISYSTEKIPNNQHEKEENVSLHKEAQKHWDIFQEF